MNRNFIILIFLLLGLLLLDGEKANNEIKNKSNVTTAKDFSIYLVADLTTVQAMGQPIHLLKLESKPILTEKDISTYKWQEHEFTLVEGLNLEEKLEGKVPLDGKPFVVVVGGESIYLGCFWTPLSSMNTPSIPVISSGWYKGSKKVNYSISNINTYDSRNDERVYESLKSLGKIIEE